MPYPGQIGYCPRQCLAENRHAEVVIETMGETGIKLLEADCLDNIDSILNTEKIYLNQDVS